MDEAKKVDGDRPLGSCDQPREIQSDGAERLMELREQKILQYLRTGMENKDLDVAVAAFLEGRIRFTQIPELIAEALSRVPARALDGIDTCVDVDTRTRATVREWLPGGVVAAVR